MARGRKKKAFQQLELERMHRRYDLAKWTLAPGAWIVSSWVPLHIAQTFSGHKTTVTVSITITIAISIVAGGTLLAMYFKSRKEREANDKLRILNAELDGKLKGVLANP